MPSLIKLLAILAIIVGIVYGSMFALVMLVEPRPGEMSQRVPLEAPGTAGN